MLFSNKGNDEDKMEEGIEESLTNWRSGFQNSDRSLKRIEFRQIAGPDQTILYRPDAHRESGCSKNGAAHWWQGDLF
jgi:hypothetical protein